MSDRQKTALDEYKLRLIAKPLVAGAKPPMLSVGVYRNNPQITVFPGHDAGTGVKVISAGMDLRTFNVFLETVRRLAQKEHPPAKIKFDNSKQIPKEQRSDPKVRNKLSTELFIGKDEDGKMWISVTSAENQSAPKVKFYFGMDYYHKLKAVGVELSEGDISALNAVAWVNMFDKLVHGVILSNGQDPRNTGESSSSNSGYGNKSGGATTESFSDGDFGDF